MKTLENKRIIVVGCGTIGGYLADMLVKAGAGAGEGELVLIDPDGLSPANLGRHRLGFPYLEQNKASALKDELVRNMPDSTIKALPVNVQEANLSKADLIVDATGEQTVSDYLASVCSRIPQLNVWIEGPGVAVRALIRRTEQEACIQCLTSLLRQGNYSSTVENMPKVYAGQGCESEYVPFPASVSIQAACLASEMIMDWSAGVNSPALRTQVLDREFTKKQEDCTSLPLAGCPACNT
jgi:tRNA A37 threonylcarbamoyladenosine dehydratase